MKTQKIHGIQCGDRFPVGKVRDGNRILHHMIQKHPDVEAVYDALESVQITLDPSDIKHGIPKDHTKCAFASAACSTLKADAAYIGVDMACVKLGKSLVRFKIPESVRLELVCFDRSGKCVPGKNFRFSKVPPMRRLGRVVRKGPGTGKKKPNVNGKGRYLSKQRTARIRKFRRDE